MQYSSLSQKSFLIFIVILFTTCCVIYDYAKPKDTEHEHIMQIFNANSFLNILEGISYVKKGKNPYEFDYLYKSPMFFYTMMFMNQGHYQLLAFFIAIYVIFAAVLSNIVRNDGMKSGLFALLLMNPYTIDMATRNSLIVFDYFWPALACQLINSDKLRNIKLSAFIFGYALHENPRGALFLSLAALIQRKKEKLEYSIKDFLFKYISYVLASILVCTFISYKLNNDNINFMITNYYNRVTIM